MPEFMNALRIRGRLVAGFGVVLAIIIVMVGVTLTQLSGIGRLTGSIAAKRVPTATISARLANDINASLAALSGWMLTGNSGFKQERAAIWRDIDTARAQMDSLAVDWDLPSEREAWLAFKSSLDGFRLAQEKVQAIARSADEQPATKLLVDEGGPVATTMLELATSILNDELEQPATADRKHLFAVMGDIRSGIAVSMANVRAYLLAGDPQFSEQFQGVWPWVREQMKELDVRSAALTPDQRKSLRALMKAADTFTSLSQTMFQIRDSEKWNMAQYLQRTEIAPQAESLQAFLTGHKGDDGNRNGGLVEHHGAELKAEAAAIASAIASLGLMEWLLLAVSLGLAFAVIVTMTRSIVAPIHDMTQAMTKLADGDLTIAVPALERRDEIGEMAKAMEVFKVNATARRDAEMRHRESQMSVTVKAERQADLSRDFDAAMGQSAIKVSEAAGGVHDNARQMLAQAEATTSLSQKVAAASAEASANVTRVAAAAEELTASIQEIQRQVSESSRMASDATLEALQTNSRIGGLAEAASRIGEVVGFITEIAGQTNLLALNATIEAARAGEAGKGFAVVANEVKNLANQTARATQDITAQVANIQAATDDAVASIGGISSTISAINDISSTIAHAVGEQGEATQEIARNVDHAARLTRDVSEKIDEVRSASGATGIAAKEVLGDSERLSHQADLVKDTVGGFLVAMRQA